MKTLKHKERADGIRQAFYDVHNQPGDGVAEEMCEDAWACAPKKRGDTVGQQHPIPVWDDGVRVGNRQADPAMDNLVILELKAGAQILPGHEAQPIRSLKASDSDVSLIRNFGPAPQKGGGVHGRARRRPGSATPSRAA